MKIPTRRTLQKYGLSEEEWIALYNKYDGCCHVCKKPFGDKRVYVEHEHVSGFKKMSPENKRKYIRGLSDFQCNKFLVSKVSTPENLRAAATYLEEYEASKALK